MQRQTTYVHDDDTHADGGNNDGIPNMEPSGQPLGVWGFWFGLWGGWEVLWTILRFVMRAWVVIADDGGGDTGADDNDNCWWEPQKAFASKFICCNRNVASEMQKKEKNTF